jgi:hypothetical protein
MLCRAKRHKHFFFAAHVFYHVPYLSPYFSLLHHGQVPPPVLKLMQEAKYRCKVSDASQVQVVGNNSTTKLERLAGIRRRNFKKIVLTITQDISLRSGKL